MKPSGKRSTSDRAARIARKSVQGPQQAKRAQRARKRGLTPVPTVPNGTSAAADVRQDVGTVPNGTPGPVVAAVLADLKGLGDLAGWQALAAGAIAMARILDDHRLASTQPAAVKQLQSVMSMLHREAAPRRGRLAAVQAMITPSRADAG